MEIGYTPRDRSKALAASNEMKISPRIIGFALIPCAIGCFFWINPPHPWTWMQTLGVCLMALGFPLWLLAHIRLGQNFAVSAQARTLVTKGLYAKIRSPIYFFGSLGIAGAFLLAGQPYLLLVFVVLIPLQIVRTRNEARALEEKFGDEYREYSRRTWF
jgi:protein-S-isoprenylcysteine O-methyltransferase Ste14